MRAWGEWAQLGHDAGDIAVGDGVAVYASGAEAPEERVGVVVGEVQIVVAIGEDDGEDRGWGGLWGGVAIFGDVLIVLYHTSVMSQGGHHIWRIVTLWGFLHGFQLAP